MAGSLTSSSPSSSSTSASPATKRLPLRRRLGRDPPRGAPIGVLATEARRFEMSLSGFEPGSSPP
eukprot:1603793-Prymnesium_polylepis.1